MKCPESIPEHAFFLSSPGQSCLLHGIQRRFSVFIPMSHQYRPHHLQLDQQASLPPFLSPIRLHQELPHDICSHDYVPSFLVLGHRTPSSLPKQILCSGTYPMFQYLLAPSPLLLTSSSFWNFPMLAHTLLGVLLTSSKTCYGCFIFSTRS